MREYIHFPIDNKDRFKYNILNWSKSYNIHISLDSNNHAFINKSKTAYHSYEFITGIGANKIIKQKPGIDSFEALKKILDENKDWWFGYFSYDLKNEIENLNSDNIDYLGFPDIFFFQPELIVFIKGKKITIGYFKEHHSVESINSIYNEILNNNYKANDHIKEYKIEGRFTKEEYFKTVKQIKDHIQLGDIYEMNFCQEFYSLNADLNPYRIYTRLNSISPTPFSCFLKIHDKYLISASPERFIKKEGEKIISQPIKGTVRRGKTKKEDAFYKKKLMLSEKDRAENIMIVDLVRNDLSKIAKKSSVNVEELCGIYSYRQVHQMISTISAKLKKDLHSIDAIKAAFPMGSMTGAPKIRAMELIEKYEKTKRGLYSGAVGYIDPDMNYDFNVVIRSILYNEVTKYLSFIVGGAITSLSDINDEYEECLLKAKAIIQVLANAE